MQKVFPSPQSEPVWFALGFAAFWVGLLLAVSFVGGWWALSRQFRAKAAPSGEHFHFRSASLGAWIPANYSNCLAFTIGSEGIHMAVLFLFRFFHPPLFIPWAMIASVEEKGFLLFRHTKLRIRDHWPIIRVYGRPGRHILVIYAQRAAMNDRHAGLHPSAPVVQ